MMRGELLGPGQFFFSSRPSVVLMLECSAQTEGGVLHCISPRKTWNRFKKSRHPFGCAVKKDVRAGCEKTFLCKKAHFALYANQRWSKIRKCSHYSTITTK
jgi:hypothetical protein